MPPRPLIAGNWKMHGLRADAIERVGAGVAHAGGGDPGFDPDFALVVCPPATLLGAVADALRGGVVELGAQDCHDAESGAHTGDVSAEMLADAGCRYVIVGHSERRANHGESDAQVRAKAAAARRAGLIAIVCLGESEATIDYATFDDLADQLATLIDAVSDEPVVSLGHASGAWLIAAHAINHPQQVRGLVTINMAGIFAPPPGALAAGLGLNPKRMEFEPYAEQVGELYTGLNFAKTEEGQRFLRAHYEAGRARKGAGFHGAAMRDMDRLRYFGTWTAPTCIVYGTHDRFSPPAHGFELNRVLPDSELHWLYPAGHFLPMEQPHQLAERVIAFAQRLNP